MKKILSMAVFMAGLTGLTYAQSTNTEVDKRDSNKREIRQVNIPTKVHHRFRVKVHQS